MVSFSDIAAGRVLGDRYEVREKLGEGDYGAVYEVFDMHLEVSGALKLLTKIDDVLQDGLWAEAAHLRRLEGEFILGVQNALFLEGVPTVVADLAERGSVAQHIVAGIGLPVGTSVRWLHQVARGLARVHDQGLLHRDIKPANVFVSATDNALLGDFGLVRIPDERGLAAAAGSTATMAPEVAAAFAGMTDTEAVYSRRSDIYGLGATGWWMFAGEPLHVSDDEHGIVQAGDPDLWDVAPHAPRRIRDAINQALRVDPAERFASAAEFDSAIAYRNFGAREWRRVQTEDGHLACFLGEGAGQPIRVCASPAGRKVAIDARYSDSGRKLHAAGRTVPERAMSASLRAVMVACSSSRR
jgi:serine/threonine protein kinase